MVIPFHLLKTSALLLLIEIHIIYFPGDLISHTNTSTKTQETHEFRVREVNGDGSCLFASVRLALGMKQMSNYDLRSVIVE